MKTALAILETNNFYRHLILFKLYIENKGRLNETYRNLENDISELLKEEFNESDFDNAVNYLDNSNYTKYYAKSLTIHGVNYIENFIEDFSKLEIEEQELLEKELPKAYFDFFQFTSNANSVLSFVNNFIKLSDNF